MTRHHLFSRLPFRFLLSALLLGLMHGLPALALPLGGPGAPPQHAQVELKPLTPVLVPGQTTWLAILVTLDPGWHVYWQNPGGAGLAPTLNWTLPEGFKAGDVLYQRPRVLRTDLGGGEKIESYAYTIQATYFVPLTPPAQVAEKEVTLTANLRFGVCAEQCFAQKEDLTLSLPVDTAQGVEDAYLAREKKLTPPDYPGPEKAPYTFTVSSPTLTPGKSAALTLTFTPKSPGDQLAFDPESQAEAEHALFVEKSDALLPGPPRYNGLAVTVPLEVIEGGGDIPATLGALVVLNLNGETVAHRLQLPLKKSTGQAPATTPTTAPGQSTGGLPPPPGGGLLAADHTLHASPTLPLLLLMALVGGVLLNLMPCVLPVLAIKVLGFVKDAHGHTGTPLAGAFAYTGGVLVSFGVLAAGIMALSRAGKAVGWGIQFSNPFFVMGMAVIMLVFALNLFGAFELTFQGGGAAARLSARQGLAGSFFSGVLATAMATPCTAPFLSPVLGFALSQPGGHTLLLLEVMGFGLALPYVVLTAWPSLLAYVPKPGPWMLRFKQLMGLLLAGTMLWLVWLMGQLWPGEGLLMLLVELFLVGAAVWCWGLGSEAGGGTRLMWRGAVAGLLLAAGLWTVVERPNPKAISPAAQLVEESAWRPFSEKLLTQLRQQGRVVFVDVTADWCLTCKANKARVLNRGGFYALTKKENVELLVADWTHQPENITRMMARYGRSAVPLYLVFPPELSQGAIVLPELLSFPVVEKAILQAGRNIARTAE